MNSKKCFIFITVVAVLIMLTNTTANAGNYFIGVKGFYAQWDSFLAQALKRQLESFHYYDYYSGDEYWYEVDYKKGNGYMLGPLLGYQTDDGLLSISVAYMVLSNFTQKLKVTEVYYDYYDDDIYYYPLDLDAKLKKTELDIALSYSVSDNVKVFVGFKNQNYKETLTLNYEGEQMKFEYTLNASFPTAGIGLVYPISETSTINLQAGILYGMYSDLKSDFEGIKYSEKLKNAPGYNFEGGVNFLLSESWILQTALRYQYLKIDSKEPNGTEGKDKFYGITVGIVYMFHPQD